MVRCGKVHGRYDQISGLFLWNVYYLLLYLCKRLKKYSEMA